MGQYRDLLKLPVPRRLALASVPADFADWMDYAAIVALLVFAWGEGPFVLALFAFCLTLPYVAVGPILAVVVDRVPLRRVLFLSNLGRGLATLALAFAGETAVVLALVFIRASVDSAFTPARQGAIQASTPEHMLGVANGLHQAINQTSKIAGPALGGLLLAVVPAQAVFAGNAVLSLVAALLVLGVKLPLRPPRDTGDFRKEVAVGMAEFARDRILAAALAFAALAYFSFFLYDALLALLADEFGLGATAFGLGIAASGGGGLVGALLAGRWASAQPLWTMVFAGIAAGSITTLVALIAMTGTELPLAPFLLVLAVMGGTGAVMLVPYRTLVQARTPPDRIARVFAAGEAVITVVMLSAPFIGSAIAAIYGTAAAFLVGGIMLLVLGLGSAAILAMRRRA